MSLNQTSTSPRTAANRQNAQLSSGPVTPEGKDAIRFNAVKHGVCSKTILLPHEDKEAFAALGEALKKTWSPVTDLEYSFLHELQESEWRLARVRTAGSNLLALGIRENLAQFSDEEDPDVRRALAEAAAWRANTKQFTMFRREENSLLKDRQITQDILTRLLQLRVKLQEEKARQTSSARLPASLSLSEICAAAAAKRDGFVPQTPASAPPANRPAASLAPQAPGNRR